MPICSVVNPSRLAWTALSTSVVLGWGIAHSVNAAELHNGWFYAIDSFTDGVTGGSVGGGAFEFYGFAVSVNDTDLTIALNANLSLNGFASNAAVDGQIHWGDLFFNFSGEDFATASSAGDLFGIRFNSENDSGVSEVGVYQTVSPMSVTAINSGFSSFNAYNDTVLAQVGTPSLGDLPADDDYLDLDSAPQNTIATGEKIGDLNWNPDLTHLDFALFGAVGRETIAFSIERSLFPEGSFIAHVLAECANDGIALTGSLPPITSSQEQSEATVPEPNSVGALVAIALGMAYQKKRRNARGSIA